jgi:transcriptional regulator with XRE-family HTH domain
MKTSRDRAKSSFYRWRIEQGLTQAQAAAVLGLHQTNVSNLDLGKFEPSPDTRLLMDAVARKIELRPWCE